MRRPVSVYCDWALHDELGDDVRLTEELTMRALDALARWQSEHGVGFDYYLIDCFWFDQPGDYTRFDREAWPKGFGPARERMEALGMKPGLWLDTTGAAVAGWRPWQEGEAEHGWAPWAGSLDCRGGWSYCLFDGPYAQGLLDAMLHACGEWGVRMFKFDFANFSAVTERFRHLDEGQVYARNVEAFKGLLARLREKYPDVLVLCYNGFAYRDGYLGNTTDRPVPGIEEHWLEQVDWLYSGDPRPADVPCTSLRRAVDMYQDHMVYKFHHSGIPLSRIDDHGCMVGETNTIYYLGKRGWRRTWIQSIARGGRKAHFYGDVTLPADSDVRFLERVRSMFFGLFEQGKGTRLVGSVPCQGPWHGQLTGDAGDGLLVLVNSGPVAQTAELPLRGLQRARVLFHDEGGVPDCESFGDGLNVGLAPEQMALVGLGRKAEEDCDLGVNLGGEPVPSISVPLDLPWRVPGGPLSCRVPADRVRERAQQQGADTLRVSVSLRRDGQAARRTFKSRTPVSQALRISLSAEGKELEPSRVVPDRRVWSGCSWVTALWPIENLPRGEELQIHFESPQPDVEVLPSAYLQS